MAITVTAPKPAVLVSTKAVPEEDGSIQRADLDGDIDMLTDSGRSPKKRQVDSNNVITPGEVVTDDPQWMRYAADTTLPRMRT